MTALNQLYKFRNRKKDKMFLLFYLPSVLILSILSMACLWGCPNAEKKIEKDQAWEIVKKDILNDNPGKILVYLSNDLLHGGQEIKSWQETHRVPNDFKEAWFFFVDDQPDANWGHKCRYIFVDRETGKYQVINSLNPPDSLEGMTQIFPQSET